MLLEGAGSSVRARLLVTGFWNSGRSPRLSCVRQLLEAEPFGPKPSAEVEPIVCKSLAEVEPIDGESLAEGERIVCKSI